jgi:hypothetical protein
LDPNFPSSPYVYVLYAHDAALGGIAPHWGVPPASFDPCPTPPGSTTDGCVVSGRLSRLQAAGDIVTGAPSQSGQVRSVGSHVSTRTDRSPGIC